jgi:hypothetical protein
MRFTKRRIGLAAVLAMMTLGLGVEAFRLARFSQECRRKAAHLARLSASRLDGAYQLAESARAERANAELLRSHRLPEGFVARLNDEDRAALALLTEMAKTTMIANNLLNKLYAGFVDRCERSARDLYQEALRLVKRADHYAALKRKYERAAYQPWFAVPPDAAEPE